MHMSAAHKTTDSADVSNAEKWLELVRRQVASLRFGVVQIVIHDSHVVQIERTEKVRLDQKTGEH